MGEEKTTVSGFVCQCDGPELQGRDLTALVMSGLSEGVAFPPMNSISDFMRKYGKEIAPDSRHTHLSGIGDDAIGVLRRLSELLEGSIDIAEHRPRQAVCTVQSDGSIDVRCPRSFDGVNCTCNFADNLRLFDSGHSKVEKLFVPSEGVPDEGEPRPFVFDEHLPSILERMSGKHGVEMLLKQTRDGVFVVTVPCGVRRDAQE